MAPRSADSRRAGVWVGEHFVQPLARGHTPRHGYKFIQCGPPPVASAPPRQSAGKAKKNKKQKKKQAVAEKQAAVVKAPEPKKAAATEKEADVSEKTAKSKKKTLKHTKPTASFFEAGTIDASAFSGGFLSKLAPVAAKQAKDEPISFGNAFASPPAAAAPADADAPPAIPHEKPSAFFKAGTIDASAFSGGFLSKPAPAAPPAKASPARAVDPLTGQAKPEPVKFGNPFSTAAADGAAPAGFSFGGLAGFNNASTDDAIGESSPEYPEEVSENEESDCTPLVDAHCPLQTPIRSPPPPALPVLQSPPPRSPALEQASVQTKAVSPDSPSLMHLARQLSTRPPPLPLMLEDPATAQLQEEVEVVGVELRQLQQAMSRLQTDHDTLNAMHEGLKREKEIMDKAGERQSLRLIEEHHKLQAQVRDGEDSVEAVEHERDLARRNVARLERELATTKKRAEAAEAAAAASSDERQTAQAAVDTLERQSSVDVDLARQLEDARGQVRAAKMQMSAEREEQARVRKEHEAREKATNGELFELRSQLSAAQAQHSSSMAQAEAETRTLTRKEKSAAEKVGSVTTRVLALLQKLSASVRLPEGQLLDEITRAEDDVRHFAGAAEQGLQRSGSSSSLSLATERAAAAPPAYGPRTPSQQRQSDAQTTRQVIDAEARASRAEARLSDSDRRCRELRKELEALRAPDAVAQRTAAAGAARAAEQALEQRAKEAEAAAKAAAREVEAVRGDATLRVGRAEQRCEELEVRLRGFEERAEKAKQSAGAGAQEAQAAVEKAKAEAAAAERRAKAAEEALPAAAAAAAAAEAAMTAAKTNEELVVATAAAAAKKNEELVAAERAAAAKERSAKDAAVAAKAVAEARASDAEKRAKAAEEAAAARVGAVQVAEAAAAKAKAAAAAAGVESGSFAKVEARAKAAEEQAAKAALGQKAAEARAEKAETTCAELRGAAAAAAEARGSDASRREELLQARVDDGAEEQARLRAELKEAREAAKDAEEARARDAEKSVERARATVYEAGSHASLAHREYEETNAEVKRLRAQVDALHSEVTEKAVALEEERGKVKVLQNKRDYAYDEAASLNRKVSFLHDEIAYFKGIFSSRDKLAEQVMKLDNELRSVRSAGSTARKQRYHTLHDGAEAPVEERRLTTPKKLFDAPLSQDSAAGRGSAAAAPTDAESVSSEGAPCRRVASTPLQKRRLDAEASQKSTPAAKRARAEDNNGNGEVFDDSSASSVEAPAALPPASASQRSSTPRGAASPRAWTTEEERVLAGFVSAFATNGKESFVIAGQKLRRAPDDVARHFLEHERRLGDLAVQQADEEAGASQQNTGADGTA